MSYVFQSTLPVGGATRLKITTLTVLKFQSTLPVGERPKGYLAPYLDGTFQSTLPVGGATVYNQVIINNFTISIHAPRGGSDSERNLQDSPWRYFNPRSPWGERPEQNCRRKRQPAFQSTLPVGGATLQV